MSDYSWNFAYLYYEPYRPWHTRMVRFCVEWTSEACMFCFPNESHENQAGELFHSNFVLSTYICTHNLWEDKGTNFPKTFPSLGKQNIQAITTVSWEEVWANQSPAERHCFLRHFFPLRTTFDASEEENWMVTSCNCFEGRGWNGSRDGLFFWLLYCHSDWRRELVFPQDVSSAGMNNFPERDLKILIEAAINEGVDGRIWAHHQGCDRNKGVRRSLIPEYCQEYDSEEWTPGEIKQTDDDCFKKKSKRRKFQF